MRNSGRSVLGIVVVGIWGCTADTPVAPYGTSVTASGIGVNQVANLAWQLPTPLLKPIRAAAAAWDGSRLYVMGGDSGAASLTTLNQIFNPATNAWTRGAPVTGARDFAAAAAMTDGIHLVGGAGAAGLFGDHRVYRRTTNTWISRARLRIPVDAPAAQVVGGKMYVIGGGTSGGPTGAVQIFNPATNTWSLGAAMPTARLSAASAKIAGKIYVAGGQTAGIGTTDVLERYDPATNRWATLAPMPATREALGGGQLNGQFCVFGGRFASAGPTGNAFPESFCYDPASNAWSRGPNMVAPSAEIASASSETGIYSLGGRNPIAFATTANQRLQQGSANVALDFRQSYVNVAPNTALDLTSTWTLEAWVFPRAAGNGTDQDIISKWAGNPGASYILQIDRAGVIRLVTSDGAINSIVLGTTTLVNGTWQHVAATFDQGDVRLYLNGVLDQSATGVRTPYVGTEPVAFGREGNFPGGTLDGLIDEVRLWNVARTGVELSGAMNQRLAGSEPGLSGYWRFDEGSGQIAYDATGGGNDGRLGTSTAVDSWDPQWSLKAPVIR